MKVKLAQCCGNCEHFINGQICAVQEIVVSENQVCEAYTFKPVLHREDDCLKCAKFQTTTCAHPRKPVKELCAPFGFPEWDIFNQEKGKTRHEFSLFYF